MPSSVLPRSKAPPPQKRSIHINEARKSKYPAVLTGPPLAPSKPISFSDSDASTVHFPHNDALIITMFIGNCLMSKILVEGGSSINILYKGVLDKMENTLETIRVMINSQIQSHLNGFDRKETRSAGTILFPVCTNPYNIITEFDMVDVESPHNVILRRF